LCLILVAAGIAGWLAVVTPAHIQNVVIALNSEDFGQNGYEKLHPIVSSQSVRAEAVKLLAGYHWDELTAEHRMEALEHTTISGWHGFTLLVVAKDDSKERAAEMARAVSKAAIAELSSKGFTTRAAGEPSEGGKESFSHVFLFVAVATYVLWFVVTSLAGCRWPRFLFQQGREKTRYLLMASLAALGIAVILIDPQTRYSHALPFFIAILMFW
jgi:hypothetical protein